MDYKVCETCFLFPLGLSRAECASWVQAWGSIIAIFAAVWIAKKQQSKTMAALKNERLQDKLQTAETLSVLAKNALKLQQDIAARYKDRTAISNNVNKIDTFVMPEVASLERSLDNIQLHTIPASLVTPFMFLSAIVRQFKIKMEDVLLHHRQMDEADFSDFFKSLDEMKVSIDKTANDFETEIKKLHDATAKEI